MSALTMIDRYGEVVADVVTAERLLAVVGITDLSGADALEIAVADETLNDMTSITKEARGELSREVVARMDMDGKWTQRVGEYEMKSSSPTAGTEVYATDLLRATLASLVEDGAISQRAADAACVPTYPKAEVGYGLLRQLAEALDGRVSQPTDFALAHTLELLINEEPPPTYKTNLRGVAALKKVSAHVAEAIALCRIEVDPPARRASIKRVAR